MVTDKPNGYKTHRHYVTQSFHPKPSAVLIMFGFIFVAATIIQGISSQGLPSPQLPENLPQQCLRPPQVKGNPHECCEIPPFFSDDDFKDCGFQKSQEHEPPRPGPPDCSKQLCILKKYELLNGESSIDYGKVSQFMDQWGDSNPDFKPAMDAAKKTCVGRELPGPPFICDANKLLYCVRATMFSECPNLPIWTQTEECTKLKEYMGECAPYFKRPQK